MATITGLNQASIGSYNITRFHTIAINFFSNIVETIITVPSTAVVKFFQNGLPIN